MPGATLLKLLVFNNTVSTKEEKQHENLLFYHPSKVCLDEKLMDAGISGSFCGFHAQFDPNSPLTSMCCDAYQYVWIEPERDFWVCAILRRSPANGSYDEDADTPAILAALNEGYRLYRLHHGSMQQHYKETLGALRGKLTLFWDVYIQHVSPLIAAGLDIFDSIGGIRYLPADRSAFLKIQSLVLNLGIDMPSLKAALVMVDNLLLYTGLNLEDTHTMCKFLASRQRSSSSKPLPADNIMHLSHSCAKADGSHVGFLTPTQGFDCNRGGTVRAMLSEKVLGRKSNTDAAPINVFLGELHESATDEKSLTEHTLVVYQANRNILAFFIDPEATKVQGNPDVNGALYRDLHTTLSVLGPNLLPNVAMKSQVWDESYQYIYFNKMNLALKESLKRKGTCMSF